VSGRYVVAADGGNSKTELVLAGADGSVLARVVGAGTRPLDHGLAATVDGLVDLISQALEAAGLPAATAIDVASFYLANVDVPDEEEAMRAALTARALAREVEVANDTLAVLRAGSDAGWGIGVVSGAGINAVGRYPDGRTERFLGLGSISGDWGGGWGVAVAGIGAAVRAGDGRGSPTVLRELVRETFGADAEAVAVAVHRREIPETRVFDFGPVVFEAATGGDAVAVALVRRLADEVVSYVSALARRMSIGAAEVDVVLGGGALQSANPVLVEWIGRGVAAVLPGGRLQVLDVAPVAGALVSALERAGAAADERARARDAVRGSATARLS
jgi:N-acetylglucosamine kinase-like BadF-type ATPase